MDYSLYTNCSLQWLRKTILTNARLARWSIEISQITIEYFPEVSNPSPLLPFNNNDENSTIKLTNLNQRRYLLLKSGMRVLHLKKFIQYKYELDQSIHVDLFYKHERLKDDHTIMDVAYIYSWRRVSISVLVLLFCLFY